MIKITGLCINIATLFINIEFPHRPAKNDRDRFLFRSFFAGRCGARLSTSRARLCVYYIINEIKIKQQISNISVVGSNCLLHIYFDFAAKHDRQAAGSLVFCKTNTD